MVFYYSGTGNSKYIAERIARATGDSLTSLNEKIKSGDHTPIISEGKIVFVTPTYGWRIPRIVEKWIRNTIITGADRVWFVMSCGSEIGNADKYLRKLCDDKGLAYMGVKQIVMPENYIAMFDAPQKDEAMEIVKNAQPDISDAIDVISKGIEFSAPRCNVYDRAMSSIVNPVFYSFFVKSKGFAVSDKCVGCGKCEKLCPTNGIKLSDGKPVWNRKCTHCMACINHCPVEAIEYSNKSQGKPRYHLD